MFDWLYFWNLIWSFFTLLGLVFVPVFIVLIYVATRAPRDRSRSSSSSARAEGAEGAEGTAPGKRGESPAERAA